MYHDIRRQVLFEARGRSDYDETGPDEKAPGNHPKLLLWRGDPVGVVRVDLEGATAIFRRVAIRSDVQRRGHGRAMLTLAEEFARDNRCVRLTSFVAPDAVGFYERCGFTVDPAFSSSGGRSVFMTKDIPA